MTSFDTLSIGEALELENSMAIGTGNFLVKVWFESTQTGVRTPDLIQSCTSFRQARSCSLFLKEMKGIDACYIVRLKPYKLMERVIAFPNHELEIL
ncbi:hypothetical protein Q361_11735 [Flavobacterium croceum DSM 17960]|uniref:Uncharacterized protein n=1 Tax=Flavobacterium croceum DSM 17960 TaxID=1121886 RepID=A0A2S4N5F5_9FLAO|nr:hypothetical protein [Flavobacterium croceum]POS00931.1 hypothetical protein Q361_11735 [Flavobacterium croceum DSM 17960]